MGKMKEIFMTEREKEAMQIQYLYDDYQFLIYKKNNENQQEKLTTKNQKTHENRIK